MIKLTNEKRNYEINVPTNFKEIDFEAIKEVISNVNVSEHYAVLCLTQAFSPFQIVALGGKSGKDQNVPVSVTFVKSNDPGNKIKANAGDKVIISRSDLEMAVHLPVTFALSTSSIISTIEDNTSLRTKLTHDPVDSEGNVVKSLLAVEFKIVPLTAIKGIIDISKKITDKYKHYMQNPAE